MCMLLHVILSVELGFYHFYHFSDFFFITFQKIFLNNNFLLLF